MFAGLSDLADRFSTFMREPMYNLGNSISDFIYGPSNLSDKPIEEFVKKVNNTSDPDVLDEVWLVLAKAFDSGNNKYIHSALKVSDTLVRNCGVKFHNSCTSLFMRRLKEMILSKSSAGGADNMKTMNEAKSIVHEWAEAFMPFASQGRGKVIVEGFQDMQRSGIHFPPAHDKPTFVPMISPHQPKKEEEKEEESFDVKAFYRKVKRLNEKIEEEGISFFENVKAQAIASECEFSLPTIKKLLAKEEKNGDDDFCDHVRILISLCQSIIKQYSEYKSSQDKSWDDDDDDDDWDWDDNKKSSSTKITTQRREQEDSSVSVRKGRTRREVKKQSKQSELELEPEPEEDFLSGFSSNVAPAEQVQPMNDFDFLSF